VDGVQEGEAPAAGYPEDVPDTLTDQALHKDLSAGEPDHIQKIGLDLDKSSSQARSVAKIVS
jgi:hypothetical protein